MATTITPVALKSLLAGLGYLDIQSINAKIINVIVTKDRDKVLPAIFKAVKVFEPRVILPTKAPFQPEDKVLEVSGIRVKAILQKNKKVAKNHTFGRENEHNLYTIINDHLKIHTKFDVFFQVNGKTKFVVYDVVRVVKTGKDTAKRKKADIELVTSRGGGTIPLSLKQLDAAYWESAITYFGPIAKNVLDYAISKNKTALVSDGQGGFKLSRNIAIEATDQETMDVVFGSDIRGRGAVIKQTWNQGSVEFDGDINGLLLDCDTVIRNLSDIPYSDSVFFQIRGHAGKNSKYLYPGLVILAAIRKVVMGDEILLPEARRPIVS